MEEKSTGAGIETLTKIATELRQLDGSVVFARLESEYILRLSLNEMKPVKIDGSLFILLAKGKITITCNSEEYEVTAPAAASFPHGTMLQIKGDDNEASEAYMLSYSQSFLQDVNISFAAISGEALLGHKSPVLDLSEREMHLIMRYFSLIETVLTDVYNTQLTRHILSSLTSAMFYQMMLLLYKRLDSAATASETGMGPRRSSYVHDFIKLVHIHYTKERSVNFYASKLFISPKYLSLLVKEATGRSAARWIDHFVITEAKNLLRYSGKNIQQVAYALNFSNQSSFGKYFKHITGMSPTEYQKS